MNRIVDLTGKRFGMLEVISFAGTNKHHRSTWLCRCDCGNEKIVSGNSLNRGDAKSCGCKGYLRNKFEIHEPIKIGQKFGKLTVVGKFKRNNKTYFSCRCDCGNLTEAVSAVLNNGSKRSCGCLVKHNFDRINGERALSRRPERNKPDYKRLHSIWSSMKSRCNNPNATSYRWYGSRGIKVCDEWNEFYQFYNWAVSNGYKEYLTLDRINNDGDYCPDNCMWVTKEQQNSNTRKNVFLTYKGETHTIAEWARITGKPYSVISRRKKEGWPIEEIIFGRPRK